MRENIDKLHEDIILITERLREHARATPDRLAYTFLRDDGKIDELTYGQLERRATVLAGALAARAPAGARALLLYPAGLEFITVYLACLLAGIIAVPATIPHKSRASRRLKALLEDADPALILTRSDNQTAIQHSLSLVEAANRACLCTDMLVADAADAADTTDATDIDLDAIRARLPQVDPESIAFLQYTSGSTSLPKGVEVTHANVAANVASIRDGFGFDPSTVMVSWLPLFHDMGLIGSVVAPLHVGFHCVLMAPAAFLKHPLSWLEAITRYRGTCAGAPNFGWDYCAAKIRDEHKAGLDLSSLSVAYNGSEPIRAATLRAFVDAFAAQGMRESALFPCYGMAETTLFVSGGPRGRGPLVRTVSKSLLEGNQIRDALPGDPDAREVVSSGRLGLGTRVRVVDPETCLPVSSHRVGEIWVAGPSVARGYWHRLEQTEATFGATLAKGDGERWLRTGDLGFLRDGELFITGRLKDLVIINGRNVYPQDIEEVIEQAIDFIEPNMCAAFSVEIGGQERLAIVAEANRGLVRAAQQLEKELARDEYMARFEATVQHIRTVIAQQFDVAVASIVFVKPGTFPRTTSGKVQRGRARELALQGALEVVYVMPGSIFDRRAPRDPAQAVAVPARVDATPATTAAPAHADAGAAQNDPAAAAAERERSRREADTMIAWLRRYAERRLNSRMIDERRTIPPYVVLDLGNAGFFGLQAPRRFGGKELATLDLMRVMEQLAAIDTTLATMVGVHNGLGIRPLLRFGSSTQQERLLPALAGGRRLGAFALTEPGAGSNPMALRASAVKTAGGWRVEAEKQWIGLASWAGLITLFAKASAADGTPLGMIALLVDADTEGLAQGPESLTMGMRGMVQNTLFLRDAFVPDDAVLLAPGEGMDAAHDAMLFSRLGIGAICIGAMKRCAQLIARYAGRRTVGTGLLAENAVSVVRLQGLTTSIGACEALVQALAAQIDAGSVPGPEVYVACKAAATEALGEAADLLVQMLGGRGYIEANGAPQILRDARVLRILEGPTETLYAHLGASLAKPGCASRAFLAGPLARPALAAELDAAVARVGELLDGAGRLFGSRGAARQWVDYRLGELAASALVLGAAEHSQASEHDGARALGASHAVVWARRRFNALLQALLTELAAQRPYSSAAELAALVAGYADAIGDVDQTLPGEEREVDALLRRVMPAPASAPAHAPAPAPAPAPAHAPVHASAALRAQVHDSILHWLRGEGRRDVHAVDFDASFATLGMDSLATATIAVDLEQRLGVPVVPEVLFDYQSINELAAFLERQRHPHAPAAAPNGTPA